MSNADKTTINIKLVPEWALPQATHYNPTAGLAVNDKPINPLMKKESDSEWVSLTEANDTYKREFVSALEIVW